MNNERILSSLAMDLKRVAIGLHRHSDAMADRFLREVMARVGEVDHAELPQYMSGVLAGIRSLSETDRDRRAEDALMYSIRVQNYVVSTYHRE